MTKILLASLTWHYSFNIKENWKVIFSQDVLYITQLYVENHKKLL